jgi:hypothetical protein
VNDREVSVDDEMPADVSTGTDRRTALKKAAIAAGVVAWTTPAVQAVTARPAHAQQTLITNCVPVLTAQATNTGPTCECVTAPSKSCCSENTYFIMVTATCGATCPGKAGVTVTAISGPPKPGCKDGIFFRDLVCAAGRAQITITGSVTCPDGKVFPVNSVVDATCIECVLPGLAATTDSNLFEEPSLDPPPETTRTETTIGGGDPPAAESPPADESPPAGQSPPTAQSPPSSAAGGSDGGG